MSLSHTKIGTDTSESAAQRLNDDPDFILFYNYVAECGLSKLQSRVPLPVQPAIYSHSAKRHGVDSFKICIEIEDDVVNIHVCPD